MKIKRKTVNVEGTTMDRGCNPRKGNEEMNIREAH